MSQFVINGHGFKTEQTFIMGNHTLVTPESLNVSYNLQIDRGFALEPLFQKGLLKPTINGEWQSYTPFQSVPDVLIEPWSLNKEAKQFAKRLIKDKKLWLNQEEQVSPFLHRDPNARLVVKTEQNAFKVLQGDALGWEMNLIQTGQNQNTPMMFISPKLGKVKILNPIKLSEILDLLEQEFGHTTTLLATCNSSRKSKTIKLDNERSSLDLDSILAPRKPALVHAYQSLNYQPKTQAVAPQQEHYRLKP